MFQLQQPGSGAALGGQNHALGEVLRHEEPRDQQQRESSPRKREIQMIPIKEVQTVRQDDTDTVPQSADARNRILRLEKSITWLQDQHCKMVAALHTEIDTLKHKNKELHFQLIMGVSGGGPQPPLGTPEEVERPEVRPAPSLPPILGAVPPLQAEILDNEIKELQAALHEAKSRNLYLSGIVEQQKRRLEDIEREMSSTNNGGQVSTEASVKIEEKIAQTPPEIQTIPSDFLRKLSEAEDMVKKLQRQNLSQKEELDSIHNSLEREARMKYRGCNHPKKSYRQRHLSNASSMDGSSRDTFPMGARTRNSSQDSQYVSMSRLELSRNSERFPPLKAMAVPRSRRQSNMSTISRDTEADVGGSDTSLHSSLTTTVLPRLAGGPHPHYSSQPALPSGQARPVKAGPSPSHGAAPGPRIVKTIVKRLPRDTGPRYGSLDRKHSRS